MGRNNSEKAASLAKEVRSFIEREPYIRNPLADGLINYSALARMIGPKIEKRLKRNVKEESLVVAIKRYADEIGGKTEKQDYLDIFANSTLTMQEGVSYAWLNSKPSLIGALESLIEDRDWHPGEVRVIVEGPEKTIVVLKTPRMQSLLEEVGNETIDFSENGALITVRTPANSRQSYGVISEISYALSKKGISIELISASPDLHFLVEEADSEEAYRTIKEIIKNAKDAVHE